MQNVKLNYLLTIHLYSKKKLEEVDIIYVQPPSGLQVVGREANVAEHGPHKAVGEAGESSFKVEEEGRRVRV